MFRHRLWLLNRIIAFVVVTIMATTCVWVKVNANLLADDITVYLDGRVLSFNDVRPQMINDRVMVPLRAIGEEMGAHVEWSAATGIAELTLGERFVRLTINSAVMEYGYLSSAENDISMYILSTPAIIKDGRTLVPLRAISEGLGGVAEWIGVTRKVILTSPEGLNNQPTPDNIEFDDTPWSENISPLRAQNMYDYDEKFVLVYYSGDVSSRLYVPVIQAAARESGVKTYCVDARLPDADELKFIWQYIDKNDAAYPIVFRVFGKGLVGVSIQPRHQENLTNLLSLFARNLMYDPDAWGSSDQ